LNKNYLHHFYLNTADEEQLREASAAFAEKYLILSVESNVI